MKMTKILADRADRPDDLVAAGEVVNMRFQRGKRALSLRAGKMVHLLVKAAGQNVAAEKAHRLRLSDFQETVHLSHSQIVDVIRELQTTLVEITGHIRADLEEDEDAPWVNAKETWEDTPEELIPLIRRTVYGPLLEHVDHRESRKNTVIFRFSRVMRSVLDNSEHWAIIDRRATMAFESRYGLRMFELISLRANLDHKTSELFNLDDLRGHLGVPEDKLVLWGHFRTRALDPAIAEVNHLASFKVAYQPVKHGRSVTGVKISWKPKEPDGLKASKRELDSHSAGRKARREGTVETVTTPTALPSSKLGRFPASGTIHYSQWSDIAKQEMPRPWQDLDVVAGQFRAWAESRSIRLDSSGIEKAFRGFCRQVKPASS